MSIPAPETATAPFWERPAPFPFTNPPAMVDVLVVGGGVTGAALLFWLRERGLRVALVERAHVAAGASGRNAGFLLSGVAANYVTACSTYGRDTAREIWAFTQDNHELLAAALGNRSAGYSRPGSAVLAADEGEADELRASAELLREDGHTVELLRRLGQAVLVNPFDGLVNPVAAVAALLDLRGEATIHEGVSVQGLEPGADGVRVFTDHGEVLAGQVVLATNGYTHRLADLSIAPRRAQMQASGPSGPGVADRPVYSDRGYRYWRQLDDGRVLVGGFRNLAFDAEVGDDDRPTAMIQARLDRHLADLGVTSPVTHRWAGTMGFTPDELPLVGDVQGLPGVQVCGGYSGHGMGFALLCARTLVEAWQGSEIPRWMRSNRFG